MLDGTHIVLDLAAQTTIALWAVKIAMVMEYIEVPPRGRYTEQERRQLRTLSVLPTRTSVWLAAAAQSGFVFTARTDHQAGPNEDDAAALATTLVFGHVALQVYTIRVSPPVPQSTRIEIDVRAGPWEEATALIWPPKESAMRWPRSVALNEEIGLNQFADRFSVTRFESRETVRLAV
jgi:hypothetical protein